MIFFCQNSDFLSKAKTHWMVNWPQFLNQLNFVWSHSKVFIQNSSQWCLRNVQLLIFSGDALFLAFHAFWFIDKDASFFHFSHKITNIRSCNGLSLLIFSENSDLFFCAPNATILLVYIPAKIKVMSFIWKDDFFLTKIGIFCKSICGSISQRCSNVYTTIFVWRNIRSAPNSASLWDVVKRASFLCPKCDNFACLHTLQDQNEFHLKKWFFFCQKRKHIGCLIGFNSWTN